MTTSHVSSGFAGIALFMWGMKSISSLTALHSSFSVREHLSCPFVRGATDCSWVYEPGFAEGCFAFYL